jgi:hypothetical protein
MCVLFSAFEVLLGGTIEQGDSESICTIDTSDDLKTGVEKQAAYKGVAFEQAAAIETDSTSSSTTTYTRSDMTVKGGDSAIFSSKGW